VEDEPEFRRRFAQIVENEPSMTLVGVAANKREAQVLLDKENFDVLLLIDLGLPDGNGIELTARSARKKPTPTSWWSRSSATSSTWCRRSKPALPDTS